LINKKGIVYSLHKNDAEDGCLKTASIEVEKG
jgi:hypothetical protein